MSATRRIARVGASENPGPSGFGPLLRGLTLNRPRGQDSDAADSQAVMRLFAWFNIARIRDLRPRDGIGRWVALPKGS